MSAILLKHTYRLGEVTYRGKGLNAEAGKMHSVAGIAETPTVTIHKVQSGPK